MRLCFLLACPAGVLLAVATQASESSRPPDARPWGISSSASAFRNHADWFPKISAAGVRYVRLFPEWRSVEPTQGVWKWDASDALVQNAVKHNMQIFPLLMGSTPWTKDKAHAFPMNNLAEWSLFAANAAARYKDQIRYWEVWNEGNGGFNDGRHTTTDYANLAAATYAAVKKAAPQAQVGLTVASFDAPYLQQAILAQAKAGKANSFDFLCIHPYEIADGIGEGDGEIPYLWMTRLVRDMLKVAAPERANAEIWITEVGRRIENRSGRTVTEAEAAQTLVKIYVMALAQGIQGTLWFEAQDPAEEDQGFGLMKRDGAPRASYGAFKTMSACLGSAPKYLGWLALGGRQNAYGFVFQGTAKPVLAAWTPGGDTNTSISFGGDVAVLNTLGNASEILKTGQVLALTDAPVFAVGLPGELVGQAQANAAKPFPWGGNFEGAATVSVQLGTAHGSKGVFQVRPKSTPAITFPDGSTGILVRGDQSTTYFVHPSFASLQHSDYYVRVTVRRVAPGNVGMNLFYEVADSQGRTPYRNREQWFSASAGNDWQAHTWHITNACFSKMWGYDIEFRPEQSVPFVIGKVEVSTQPFSQNR